MDENILDPRFESDLAEVRDMPRRLKVSVLPVVRDLTVKHTGISDEDMAEAIAAQRMSVAALEYSLAVLELRSRWRKLTPKHRFISLGFDCLPRTLATKYGVIESRAAGRLTCPFDLSVHPLPAVVELLQNDFAGYQEPDQYGRTARGMPCHQRLGAVFNHDLDEALAADNFAQLRVLYEKRAQNFREYARRPNALFVANIRAEDASSVPELVDVVGAKYPDAKLVLISTDGGLIKAPVEVISSDIPRPDYSWFMVQDFATPEGLAFERRIVDRLAQICLADDGGVQRAGL